MRYYLDYNASAPMDERVKSYVKEIMDIFKIQPCKEVGVLKDLIKNAILDGVIKNDYKQAKKYLFIKAKELGINEK